MHMNPKSISIVDDLIIRLDKFQIPTTLKELNDLDNINIFIEEIENSVNNIWGTEAYQNLKNELQSYFSSNSVYAKNIKEERRILWEEALKKVRLKLTAIRSDLEQKIRLETLINNNFIEESIIINLRAVSNPNFDLRKLIQFCEELNSNYKTNNFLSCILILRAVLNYVPPIFGYHSFAQVVSQSGRSLKDIFGVLENECRKVADLHTHLPISKNESLPTKNQIEPFKVQFEILIVEIYKTLK